jgi:DNA-binding beta-propeller fold protein YncE
MSWVSGSARQAQHFIRFDWGDGDTSVWCGPGETARYSHSWSDGEVYAVRAQARDDRTEFSDWSEPCSVKATVPPYPFRLVNSVFVADGALEDIHVWPTGEFVYVTSEWDASLWVVRTSDMQVVAEIPFYAEWWGEGGERVVCSPDGEYVYATGYRYDYLAVVSTSTQAVVESLYVGEPWGLAISPDGSRLYVAVDVYPDYYILVARAPDVVVEDTLFSPHGGTATCMTVSSDGSRLYGSDVDAGSVCSIVVAADSVEWQSSADVYEGPDAIIQDPAGNTLYVLEYERVTVLQSATGLLTDSIPVEPYWGADIAPDGSFLYLTYRDDAHYPALAVVSTSDGSRVRLSAAPDEILDVAASPDGRRLYLAGDHGTLYALCR